jgi:glutathione-independent formaldehyde dehydrogenase
VPFGDANCLKLPGESGDAWEEPSFCWLTPSPPAIMRRQSSMSAKATQLWYSALGLLAAYSARLRGAAQVYSVDAIPDRLDKAGELGAIPINFIREDTVELIREHQSKWRSRPCVPEGESSVWSHLCD